MNLIKYNNVINIWENICLQSTRSVNSFSEIYNKMNGKNFSLIILMRHTINWMKKNIVRNECKMNGKYTWFWANISHLKRETGKVGPNSNYSTFLFSSKETDILVLQKSCFIFIFVRRYIIDNRFAVISYHIKE